MTTHKKAIAKLALAKLIANDPGGIDYWAKEVSEYPAEEVSVAVDAIIDSGVDYVHLGMVKKAVRDYRLHVMNEQRDSNQMEQSKGERFKEGKKGSVFFKMITEAMAEESPVDIRKALLKANEYGRANTAGMDADWDKSDRDHKEAIARLGG